MATCPKCGADNPDYLFYCGKCSAELRDSAGRIIQASGEKTEAASAKTAEAQTGEKASVSTTLPSPLMAHCAWCGKQVNSTTLYCPFCGKNPRGPWEGGSRESDHYDGQTEEGTELHSSHASGTLVLGGVMAILAGVLALGQGLLLLVASSSVSYIPGSGSVCFCGGLDALFGIGALVGGISAIQRKSFAIALVGAIVGMLGLGLLIGALFGLIAIICIAISRQEFTD